MDKKPTKAKVNSEIAKAKAKMKQANDKVVAYIKKNPEEAALISAGVGAALGATISALLVSKSRKKKKAAKLKKKGGKKK